MSSTYHHGNLKSELIRLGLEALEQQDLGFISLRGLAQAAGVSKAAPYRHFSDKEELLAALTAEGFRMFTVRLDTARKKPGIPPLDILVLMCRAYTGFAREHPRLFYLMFSSYGLALHSPECSAEGQKSLDVLRQAIQSWQPQLSGEQQEYLTLAVWAYIHGITSLIIEGFIDGQDWEGELGSFLRSHLPGSP